MRLAENVYPDVYCSRAGARFLVCFPQFTGRRGGGITSGRISAPRSLFRTAPDCSERRATQARLRPGFRTLRHGPGVVATPMASGGSKEDAGKSGASPAPLPKVLEVHRGKTLVRIAVRIGLSNDRRRAETTNFVLNANHGSREKI